MIVAPAGFRLGLLLLGLQLITCSIASAQRTVRSVDLEEEAYFPYGTDLDFGVLEDRVSHPDTLWLKNPSTTPMVVQNVRTSCGCTVVSWPEAAVAPGQIFAIPVRFRCLRASYVEKDMEIWITGRRKPIHATVLADCNSGE